MGEHLHVHVCIHGDAESVYTSSVCVNIVACVFALNVCHASDA